MSCGLSLCDSRHHFRVTVHQHTTTYLIVSGHAVPAGHDDQLADEANDDTAEFTPDQLLTGNTMHWQRASDDSSRDDSGSGQRLVVSSGGPGTHSERCMEDGRMVVVNEKDGVRATSWFERRDAAVRPLHDDEERKQKLLHDHTT